jgi:hypothetical protein
MKNKIENELKSVETCPANPDEIGSRRIINYIAEIKECESKPALQQYY